MPPDQGSQAWCFHADQEGKRQDHPWGQQSHTARQGARHGLSSEGPRKAQVALRGRNRPSLQWRRSAEGVGTTPTPLLHPPGLSRFKPT